MTPDRSSSQAGSTLGPRRRAVAVDEMVQSTRRSAQAAERQARWPPRRCQAALAAEPSRPESRASSPEPTGSVPDLHRQRRLRRREPRDRHAVRRAAHVVEADLVEEVDRRRVAAVLAADAELEVGPRLAALLDAPSPRAGPTPSVSIDANGSRSRIFLLLVDAQELARRRRARSRRSAASGRWCRTRRTAPPAAISSAVIAPRGTSIIVPTRYLILTPCSFITSAATRSTIAFWSRSSFTWPTSGIMISGTTLRPSFAQLARRLDDGARLHLGDLGIGDAEAHAAVAEHRVELVELLDARAAASSSRRAPRRCLPLASSCAISTIRSSRFGRNSCSGGSIVRMVTGAPCIALNTP